MILLKQAHIFRVISVILDAERGVAYGSINIACVRVLQEKNISSHMWIEKVHLMPGRKKSSASLAASHLHLIHPHRQASFETHRKVEELTPTKVQLIVRKCDPRVQGVQW